MDEFHKVGIIVIPISWMIGLLGALALYFCLNDDINSIWTTSYVLGILTGLMNFGLTFLGGKGFQKALTSPNSSPIKTTVLSYFLRLLVASGVFLAVVFNQLGDSPRFNVIPTLIGFSVTKVVWLIVMVVRKGKVTTE